MAVRDLLESLSHDLRTCTQDVSSHFRWSARRAELSVALQLCSAARQALGPEAFSRVFGEAFGETLEAASMGLGKGQVLDVLDSARFEEKELRAAREAIEAKIQERMPKDVLADVADELQEYFDSEAAAVEATRRAMERDVKHHMLSAQALHRDITAALERALRAAREAREEEIGALATEAAATCRRALANWLKYSSEARPAPPGVLIPNRLLSQQSARPALCGLVQEVREAMRLRRRQLRLMAAAQRLACCQDLLEAIETFRAALV